MKPKKINKDTYYPVPFDMVKENLEGNSKFDCMKILRDSVGFWEVL